MLSFVIPVFNGENCIKECVSSVIKSVLKDFEIIIVDDGSTDKTPDICDELSKKYNNIDVIHIENSGQGVARNFGLKKAKGDYIAFIDADDIVTSDGFANMYEIALTHNYDIVNGTYYRIKNGEKELVGSQFSQGELSRYGDFENIKRYNNMKTQSIFGYLWNKIYKKEFLISNNLWIDDIRKVYMEDTIFNIRAFGKDPKYFHTKTPVYCYYAEQTSTTRKYEPDINKKSVKMLEILLSKLKEEKTLDKSMDLVVPLAMRSFSWSMVRNYEYEGNSFKNKLETILLFSENKTFRYIISNKKEFKKIPSLLEKKFYSVCATLIKLKLYKITAIVFFITNPIMQGYINKNLK